MKCKKKHKKTKKTLGKGTKWGVGIKFTLRSTFNQTSWRLQRKRSKFPVHFLGSGCSQR